MRPSSRSILLYRAGLVALWSGLEIGSAGLTRPALAQQAQWKTPGAAKPAPAPRPAAAPALRAPAAVPRGNEANPPTHRTVIHTEAYKKREGLGPHVNFKITPPEKRGQKGRVLVEAYNYSKTYLSIVDFWLHLSNSWGDKIEVKITCDDIQPGWSALKWVKIPGNKPIPEITKVEILNMNIFDDKGRKVQLKYYTDLIKQ